MDVESEAGGVDREHGQPEDSDDVIGPPLPPGYNVRVLLRHTCKWFKTFLGFYRSLRLVLVVVWSITVKGRGQRRRRKVM